MKWHYQFTPHDVHDWDATEPNVLVDTKFRGLDRKLLLHADRNGFFYVFDRTDGQLLLTQKLIRRLTWASGIGPDGRPLLLPETDVTCPEDATNWNGTAFSPVTRLYYVMVLEKCAVKLSPGSWKSEHPREEPGKKYLRALDIDTGQIVWEVPEFGPTDGKKYLRALDIETGKFVWEIPEFGPTDGKRMAGVLATAAGILFYGDPSGEFVAVDDRDGKALWHLPLNAIIKTSPMTYTVDGEQFIALAVGSNIMCFGLIR